MIHPRFNFWSNTAGIIAFISLTTPVFAQFAYVVNNGSQDVSGYKINANGSLTELPGSPFAAGNQPTSMAVNPAGTFA
jgi:DNA-binding beta-propeller fold protein YncE